MTREPAVTSLFTDFDGTLSPIVADPAAAAPVPGSVSSLQALAQHYRRVAVISGRPLSYLDPLLPAAVDIAALYGLEQRESGRVTEHPDAARWRPVISHTTAAARVRFGDQPGINVEAKGLSLTIHYRNAAQHDGAAEQVRQWAEQEAEGTGLLARGAKASVELHPPVTVDKGIVVARWAKGSQVVAFFGDDLGDLTAFHALARMAEMADSGPVETFAVIVAGTETPPEVLAAADVVLDGPMALAHLLEGLVVDLT